MIFGPEHRGTARNRRRRWNSATIYHQTDASRAKAVRRARRFGALLGLLAGVGAVLVARAVHW